MTFYSGDFEFSGGGAWWNEHLLAANVWVLYFYGDQEPFMDPDRRSISSVQIACVVPFAELFPHLRPPMFTGLNRFEFVISIFVDPSQMAEFEI